MENKHPYSVKLGSLIEEFQLEEMNGSDYRERLVVRNEVNRPGLALAGFSGYFEPERIQVIGLSEADYLSRLPDERQQEVLEQFFSLDPIAVVFSTSLPISDRVLEIANRHGIPILRTAMKTSEFTAALVASLNVSLAPRITRHGVLVEVYGEGILILGDSGIGKSEAAIELMKRGHRLVADDAVEISALDYETLQGTAPALIRHYVELRGIGIIDVRQIFGAGAVKEKQTIHLVVNLEQWREGVLYDRLGLNDQYVNILGIDVPSVTIPVRPGRNLAFILEVAAMNARQRHLGYNAAQEFTNQINKHFDQQLSGQGNNG
jgi:HPr kinase/phosphorylase